MPGAPSSADIACGHVRGCTSDCREGHGTRRCLETLNDDFWSWGTAVASLNLHFGVAADRTGSRARHGLNAWPVQATASANTATTSPIDASHCSLGRMGECQLRLGRKVCSISNDCERKVGGPWRLEGVCVVHAKFQYSVGMGCKGMGGTRANTFLAC